MQFHTGPRGEPVYHGQGGDERRRAEDLRRFVASVDEGLAELTMAEIDAEIAAARRERRARR